MELVANDNKVDQFVADLKRPETGSEIREQALTALKDLEFPHSRVEEWKYTRVSKYVKKNYRQQEDTADISNYLLDDVESHQLVFVNGFFDEKASKIIEDEALVIKKIDELDPSYYFDTMTGAQEFVNIFAEINKAYQTGGIYVEVAKNKKAKPIQLIHVVKGQGIISNARHFLHVNEGAELEVISSYNSIDSDDSFTNTVFEGHVEKNANLTLFKLQYEEENTFHIHDEVFVQERDSNYTSHNITTGGLLTRNGINVSVRGENCHTELNGIYLGTGNQHIDNHTTIDQRVSNCTSNELYKGVMDDQSKGVFNGRVIVRENAQKIDAYQSNKNILISEKSQINSKPELEIYADDVKCSHGSTVGDLDDDAMFYLQTRGIGKEKAKQLLVGAFIVEVLDRIKDETIQKIIKRSFVDAFDWDLG